MTAEGLESSADRPPRWLRVARGLWVLEGFAATARDETDLDRLTAELVRVIQETMEPEFVSIWLRPMEDRRQTANTEPYRNA